MAKQNPHDPVLPSEVKGLPIDLQRKLVGRQRPGKFRASARPTLPTSRARSDTTTPISAPPGSGDKGKQRAPLERPQSPVRRESARPALPSYQRKTTAVPLSPSTRTQRTTQPTPISPTNPERRDTTKPELDRPAGHSRRAPVAPLPVRPHERTREGSRITPISPSRQPARRESLVGLSPLSALSSSGEQDIGLPPPLGFDGEIQMESLGQSPRGITGIQTYSSFFHGGGEG